ncbi:hypothetical protein AKJ09_06462 [Labilithrix luteola]|uniref:Carbohydrate-binding domain-containing protein n=1 Tax=Labilithrix luteola TaxID=1391654 RepID=A0A0K1Q1Y8_9BACT|nr:hypothetical protein [Labilithrix luteola]AKU99798.1 hypothetical protein AKJ09_06462 [Labilithrix luteola]
MKRAFCILSTGSLATLFALGCGGGGAPAKAPDAKDSAKDDSIGELAAAQGGLASLGGAGNREQGGATGTEVAMTGPLRAEEVDRQNPVRLDGVLKEWHARSAAKEALEGSTSGLGLAVAVQYDDAKVYVAGEITDPKLTRTKAHGDGDDRVTMTLAFPSGRGSLKAYEIGFWAGKPGESSGVVKWLSGASKGESVAGARIVEADIKGGYSFEAAIPWSSFPEARTMRLGLRGALRYHDADGHAVLGTGPGNAEHAANLPALPTASEQAVVDGLLGPKNLAGETPKIDVFADVTGDERKERISVFGRFFTICGPGYRGGKQFFWREIAGDLVTLETRDLEGRGKDDLVVRRRVTSNAMQHEVLEIWSLGSGDEPVTAFSQEIAITSSDGKKRVSNAIRVSSKEVEVSVEPATGWDMSNFPDAPFEGENAVLLPWGNVKSRTFRYDKGKLTKVSEVPQAGKAAPFAKANAASESQGSSLDTGPSPSPPSAKTADMAKALLDAYARDTGTPAGTKPRFDLEVSVDGDSRPERVLLIGRDVVVFGPGFKGGNAYSRLTLSQFETDKDVAEMTVRDVTGDGAADIVIRGLRRVTTPQGEKVDVDGMFIYQVKSGNIARIFAVETSRGFGGKRIQGLSQFVPAKSGKGFDIELRPGVAKGWTEKTYPWPQDKPGGSIEPLLLPWGKLQVLRYSFNGTQYATP